MASHDFIFIKNMTVVQRLNTNYYERIYRQNGIDASFLRFSNTKEKLLDYELNVNLDSENMNTILGLELSDPSFKNDRAQGETFTRKTRGLFIQNDYKYSENHKIITGIRYDKYGNEHVYSQGWRIYLNSLKT